MLSIHQASDDQLWKNTIHAGVPYIRMLVKKWGPRDPKKLSDWSLCLDRLSFGREVQVVWCKLPGYDFLLCLPQITAFLQLHHEKAPRVTCLLLANETKTLRLNNTDFNFAFFGSYSQQVLVFESHWSMLPSLVTFIIREKTYDKLNFWWTRTVNRINTHIIQGRIQDFPERAPTPRVRGGTTNLLFGQIFLKLNGQVQNFTM